MLDDATINRLRLWLRSERSMGLPSVGPGRWPDSLPNPTVERRAAPDVVDVVTRTTRSAAAPGESAAGNRAAPTPTAPHSAPFTSSIVDPEQRKISLALIDANEVTGCVKCPLSNTRTHTVFGEGASDARLMFIGEGPGSREDQTGRPFVGPAGELLNRMIGAMGLSREQVYIANIIKCRAFHAGPPPKDRAPSPEEVAACAGYLQRQVEIIRPSVIVTLGLPAAQFVLQSRNAMSKLRGTWSAWHDIKVMPTWHPAYLLRCEKEGNIEPKRQTWSDLQQVMKELGLAAARKSE